MRSLDEVAAYVRRRHAEVDQALEHVLPPAPSCPSVLRDAMRYSPIHPGPWAPELEEKIVAKVHELHRALSHP